MTFFSAFKRPRTAPGAGRRIGVRANLTFQDLRTTALTEMGNAGSTNVEIISFSGHKLTSPVLAGYVLPDREAARRGRAKRDGIENPGHRQEVAPSRTSRTETS